MARMSDFHVVGDPRYAPDTPGGSGGVSKEYVDNADLEVKRTAAKGHNTKYDEAVIPSQYANKLYVYNDPESMYKASEQGESGEGFFENGDYLYRYHGGWDWSSYTKKVARRYDDNHKGVAIVKHTPLNATPEQILDKYFNSSIVAGDGYPLTILDNDISSSVNSWSLTHSVITVGIKNNESGYVTPTESDYSSDSIFNNEPMFEAIPTHALPYPQEPNYFNEYVYTSANLPIFDLDTQTGVDAFNTYQTTGDYSGAINYSDLNPLSPDSFVAIDVISGDWYVIVNDAWVKQGTLALAETGGTEVEANPQGTPTDTLNSIEIDGVIYDIEGGSGASSLSSLSDVNLTNLANGQILQWNSTSEKWENADNQGGSTLPFDIEIDETDNGVNIVYDDSILNGGE